MASTGLLIGCGMAVLACALASGFFLTFSDFVMDSLGAARPASGIESMQEINRKALGSGIVRILWCMFVGSFLLIGFGIFVGPGNVLVWIVAGGALYFVGGFIVTFRFNIPMNERLDEMDFRAAETEAYWRSSYLPSWTFWNSVRALMTGGSAVCYLVAVVMLAGMAD